jgi:hypothetical protein
MAASSPRKFLAASPFFSPRGGEEGSTPRQTWARRRFAEPHEADSEPLFWNWSMNYQKQQQEIDRQREAEELDRRQKREELAEQHKRAISRIWRRYRKWKWVRRFFV